MVEHNKPSTIIFLLLSIALIVAPHAVNIPGLNFSFFSILLAWRFVGIWKPNWLPGKALIFLLTVAGFLLFYYQHHSLLGRDAGTTLIVSALGLKLLEINNRRDLFLIIYLAFIVAASQFLFKQNILMAGYILMACSLLLGTLVFISCPQIRPYYALKTAMLIVLQAIPLMIVTFIFFPRVEPPSWMMFADRQFAQSGLESSMEPGSISQLGLSDELVFRVKFAGAIPPSNQRYWRGPVYTHTDGKRWTVPDTSKKQTTQQTPQFLGQPYQYTLMMEPQNKDWVYALDLPAEYPSLLKSNAHYQLITGKNPQQRTEYKITSYPQYNTGDISPETNRDALQLPDKPSDKIIKLVTQLHGFDRTPEYFIQQLLNHFNNEDFYYTLRPPLMRESPIETFLFSTRRGFCSHYATAFVYLMRVANIPARVVGGYQGGKLNNLGNFLEIRQANAHAWTEVWLQNRGWVRIDPTAVIAPDRIEQDVNIDLQIASGEVNFSLLGIETNLIINGLKHFRYLWNSVDYNWKRWVINYSNSNQSRFLSLLGITNIQTMIYSLATLIATLTLTIYALLFRRQKNYIDPALLMYQQYCRKLSKTGLLINNGEGAQDFAARCKHSLPRLADKIEHITALYIKIRYQKNSNETDLKTLKNLVYQFKLKS